MTEKDTKGKRRLKISEIAQLADTSAATVSKVINGYGSVASDTRDRVERILSEIEYSKKPVKHAKSSNIALLFDRMDRAWVSQMIAGGMRYADRAGLNLIVVCRTDDKGRLSSRYLQSLRRSKPLAVVINTTKILPQEQELFHAMHTDYAVLDYEGDIAPQGTKEVRLDNWAGGLAVGRYLLSLGHRRIAIITGPDDMMCFRARVDGCKAALSQASLPVDANLIRSGDTWSELARRSALELFDMENPPTAIFATCDVQAIGIYDAAHQRNVSIPRDVSVVGFDDNEFGRHLSKALTTVHQPYSEMADEAFSLILKSGNSASTDRGSQSSVDRLLVPPELVIRESTAPVF